MILALPQITTSNYGLITNRNDFLKCKDNNPNTNIYLGLLVSDAKLNPEIGPGSTGR